MDWIKKSIECGKYAVVCMALKALSAWKISFIVGSQTAFFSGASVSVPFVGFFAGSLGSLAVFLLRFSNWFLYTTHSWHLLSFVIPGFCASLYWTSKGSFIRFWIPVLCIGAFVAHPVGREAYMYTWYWLIPLALYVLNSRSTLWADALGSTLVAHAVGSVIWIYTMPTTASLWILLIPIVAIERLLCAASMVALCYGYRLITHIFDGIQVRVCTAVQQYRQA
jgi:hypothetical protein